MTQDVTELIGKLLRQAEGTTHDGERETFMDKAMLLAQQNNIDLAVARAVTARTEAREQIEEQTIQLGPLRTRGLRNYAYLFMAIGDGHDVHCLIAHNNTYITPFGYPSDINLVKSLYQSLVVQMVAAGDAYIRTGEYKSHTIAGDWDYWTQRYEQKPLQPSTARQQFYVGFVEEVGRRIKAARDQALMEAEARRISNMRPVAAITADGTVTEAPSIEMVLRAKTTEVNTAWNIRRKNAGTWRGGRVRQATTGARTAGSNAGAKVDLHSTVRKPIEA